MWKPSQSGWFGKVSLWTPERQGGQRRAMTVKQATIAGRIAVPNDAFGRRVPFPLKEGNITLCPYSGQRGCREPKCFFQGNLNDERRDHGHANVSH
ncbi:MAG TPA: hypothetical protein DDZ51_02355 [Planctomycetaceae bacterium]|nr:hypothetical protein [Planctomycetaceae bacterium]